MSRDRKQELYHSRIKERVIGFLSSLKNNDEIVQVVEVSTFLKQKFHEYQRMNLSSIEKQVKCTLDSEYKIKTGLNMEKPHYKKRDFCEVVESEPVMDSYGEELVEHKTLNLMNQSLPIN